jgi:transposase
MTRYGIRDDPWERIRDLLPGKLSDVGATARDDRRFVEAVLYRGTPWRDLRERFGDWKNTHRRFSRWAKPAYGSASLSTWQPMAITNTR